MTDKETSTHHAELYGSGAAAQGYGAVAASGGSVAVGRDVHGDVINVTYQGARVTIPSPEAIAAHRAALREKLAQAAQARWGGMAVYIREEGAALPIQASPYQQGALGPRADLLATLKATNRLLVLGEPGAGKTVAMERLAWDLCNGSGATIPVLVRLFHYAGTPLAEWVRATLQAMGYLRLDDGWALAAFLKAGIVRCTFLFDGLNEVAPPHRDRLQDELVRWMAAYPRHPVILTSRAQDELWRRVRETVGQAVVVQPIADAQAQAYLEAHLPEKGRALYARLDKRLRSMARTPLVLWLIKEAGVQGESIPGNRGELYGRFVSRMLRRDTDRRMDAEIPEWIKRRALAMLAYHLSIGRRLTCSSEEAEAVAAQSLGNVNQARAVIGACARHGLLAGEATKLWFSPHQTVQEYFAALALRARWKAELQQPVLRRWWDRIRGQSVLRLAGSDWWAEPFVQLAGLVGDADALARGLARENPWLAWWCVEEGRGVSAATRAEVEARSIKLLQSGKVADRRRAVTALAQMRNERVVAPLFYAAGDDDAEVAQFAVQALAPQVDIVRPLARQALRGKHIQMRLAACRCLMPLLDFEMVYIPPGPFLMGSDKGKDFQMYGNELPRHKVTLPGYWIGKTPVTVARFRHFVRESGYTWENAGKEQGGDDHPVVYVTWHDALAYCRWLEGKTGLPVTLPSEAEWEKAARGADGRIYPWGDEPPTADLCNFSNNVGDTTPAGTYSPVGDSPYDCVDMAGNVWEWTRSLWGTDFSAPDFGYPYDPEDGRENLEAGYNVLRVLRGGSFVDTDNIVRCAFRDWNLPSVPSLYVLRVSFGGVPIYLWTLGGLPPGLKPQRQGR